MENGGVQGDWQVGRSFRDAGLAACAEKLTESKHHRVWTMQHETEATRRPTKNTHNVLVGSTELRMVTLNLNHTCPNNPSHNLQKLLLQNAYVQKHGTGRRMGGWENNNRVNLT